MPLLFDGGRRYFEEGAGHGSFAGGFDAATFSERVSAIIRSGSGKVWASFDAAGEITGALFATAFQWFYNNGLTAQVVFWYCIPERRGGMAAIRLFDAFESWSCQIGAKRRSVGHLARLMPEKFASFYRRRGYELNEINYMKTIQ